MRSASAASAKGIRSKISFLDYLTHEQDPRGKHSKTIFWDKEHLHQ